MATINLAFCSIYVLWHSSCHTRRLFGWVLLFSNQIKIIKVLYYFKNYEKFMAMSGLFFVADSHLDSLDLNSPGCRGLIQVGLFIHIKKKRTEKNLNQLTFQLFPLLCPMPQLLHQALSVEEKKIIFKILKRLRKNSLAMKGKREAFITHIYFSISYLLRPFSLIHHVNLLYSNI